MNTAAQFELRTFFPKGKWGDKTLTLNTAVQWSNDVTLKGYSGAVRAANLFLEGRRWELNLQNMR